MAGYCFRKADGKIMEVWQDHRGLKSSLDNEGNLILQGDKRAIRDRDEEIKRGYAREKTELIEDEAKAPKVEPAAPVDEAPPADDEPRKDEGFPNEELKQIEKEDLAPVAEPVEGPDEREAF